MELAVVKGKTVAYQDLDPIYFDRAFYYGDGVYEVIRSYNGHIFALDEHLTRLENSLKGIAISGVDMASIREQIETCFTQSEIANAKIYCHITRGSTERDLVAEAAQGPNFFMTITELPLPPEQGNEAIVVGSHPDQRWKRCDIKSLNLLPNVLARRAVEKQGASEAILVDDQGWITEGAASAFFAVGLREDDGGGAVLQTAPLTANILPSVTRAYVLKAAERLGLPVLEESLTVPQAQQAAELFIAVTTRDIIPIKTFDRIEIGGGAPGTWTQRLQGVFDTFTGVAN